MPGPRGLVSRPLHRRPGALFAVLVGGTAGTLARWGLGRALPVRDGWPLGTLAANLAGAFLLGLLLEALARSGADEGGRRTARLLLGTGFCGAFTTMSSLDVEVLVLVQAHRPGLAAAYLAASLAAGLVLACAGIATGRRLVAGGSR